MALNFDLEISAKWFKQHIGQSIGLLYIFLDY